MAIKHSDNWNNNNTKEVYTLRFQDQSINFKIQSDVEEKKTIKKFVVYEILGAYRLC